MPLTLNHTFVDDFFTLADAIDHPELLVAAQLVDLAWHRQQAAQDPRLRWISLTPRQQEVAQLILTGRTFPEIAAFLHLSGNSVHSHTRLVYARMGVASKKELRTLMLASDLLDEYMEKFRNPA